MAFFYKSRYEVKDNKRYIVLRTIPQLFIVNAVLVVVLFVVVYVKIFRELLGKNYLIIAFILLGIFALDVILLSIDRFKATIARFKKKEVMIKGGTTVFNFKNPQEIWIEQ
jgi:hypothetical protein